MKKITSIITIILMSVGLQIQSVNATTSSDKLKLEISRLGEDAVTDTDYKKGIIKHIVLFRYKENVTPAQKEVIKKRFLNLAYLSQREGRRYILSIKTGSQNSGEGVDQEFEQGFIVTFKSEGDRNYYVGKDLVQKDGNFDPAHDNFKKFVGPFLHEPIANTGVLVFDFREE